MLFHIFKCQISSEKQGQFKAKNMHKLVWNNQKELNRYGVVNHMAEVPHLTRDTWFSLIEKSFLLCREYFPVASHIHLVLTAWRNERFWKLKCVHTFIKMTRSLAIIGEQRKLCIFFSKIKGISWIAMEVFLFCFVLNLIFIFCVLYTGPLHSTKGPGIKSPALLDHFLFDLKQFI